MSRANPSEDSLWLRRYREPQDPTARLVCFPHAGGTAPFFRPVPFSLKAPADVIAVQYPGRQDRLREKPISDIRVLAAGIHEVLKNQQPELPLVLFGHSMGAAVAFEVARLCEAKGRRPARLVVSGRRGPAVQGDDDTVHQRDDQGILEEIRRLNGSAAAVLDDPELMQAALPSLRADYHAIETYRAAPWDTVSCPITVMTADDDPRTSVESAKEWRKHTTATCDVEIFHGGHFYLVEEMPRVVSLLDGYLTAASNGADDTPSAAPRAVTE